MSRVQIDWDQVFTHMREHPDETRAETARRFEIKAQTLRPAVQHEASRPGGGRLAGHPVVGADVATGGEVGALRSRLDQLERELAKVAAVYVPIADLRRWAANPRKNKATIEIVAASIIRFGFAAPLVARLEDRELIAGHSRIAAAMSMPERYAKLRKKADAGDERSALALAAWHPEAVALATDAAPSLPVRYRDLTAAEAHDLALVDNKSAEYSEWDLGGLASFQSEGVDLGALGWSEHELGELGGAKPSKPAMNGTKQFDGRPANAERRHTVEMHVVVDDATIIDRAIDRAMSGKGTRGEALARVCRDYLARTSADG